MLSSIHTDVCFPSAVILSQDGPRQAQTETPAWDCARQPKKSPHSLSPGAKTMTNLELQMGFRRRSASRFGADGDDAFEKLGIRRGSF